MRGDYLAPPTLEAALATLRSEGEDLAIIAGGTDLIPRMQAGEIPATVLDLRLLPMKEIQLREDLIAIGGCVTHTQMVESGLLARHTPALVQACREIGGPPIRNRGTLGGNLVNASPAADTAPPLLAYDARVVLAREGSEREVDLATFFTAPGETVIEPDELLREVRIPLPEEPTAATFLKLGKRRAMAIAVVSVAVRLTATTEGAISRARIALGSVAPTPIRATVAEAFLVGHKLDEARIAEAAEEAVKATAPISDIRAGEGYRRRMVTVLTRRALAQTLESLRGAGGHG